MSVPVASPGTILSGSDRLELFLKNFAGETLAAFARSTKTGGRHMTRNIASGKSASFPVLGRTKARYLAPGKSLDENRHNIKSNEVVIVIDGLLVADCMITDIDDAMSHFEVRSEYTAQIGEALAMAADGAVFAEIGKLVVADTANIPDETGVKGTGKPTKVDLTDTVGSEKVSEARGLKYMQALLKMQYGFDMNYIPETDRTAYVRPDFAASLVSAKIVINADYSASGNVQEGRVTRVSGFDIICAPNLTDGGADVTDIAQGAGHVFPVALKDTCAALCCHRTAVGTLMLKNLAIEHARRTEYQADLIVAKYAIGHKGLRPEAVGMITMTETA